MTILQAVLLGIVQGLTEFLPISSSGHLVFFQHLLGFDEPMIAFDVVVHLGTLLAIFVYFGRDIVSIVRDVFVFVLRFPKEKNAALLAASYPHAPLAAWLIITTGVTGVFGLTFKGMIHSAFGSLFSVGVAWVFMGGILYLSRRLKEGRRPLGEVRWRDAVWIGLAQAAALAPGISRSGSTILAGMACGLEKKDAARYSFLAGILAILAAGALEFKDAAGLWKEQAAVLTAGFFSAAAVGYLAIWILMKIIEKGRFFIFGIYCFLMSLAALAVHFGAV